MTMLPTVFNNNILVQESSILVKARVNAIKLPFYGNADADKDIRNLDSDEISNYEDEGDDEFYLESAEGTKSWALWQKGENISSKEKAVRVVQLVLWICVCFMTIAVTAYSAYYAMISWVHAENTLREEIYRGELHKRIGHHASMVIRPFLIHPNNDPIWADLNSTHIIRDEFLEMTDDYHYSGRGAFLFCTAFLWVFSLSRCVLFHSPLAQLYPYVNKRRSD